MSNLKYISAPQVVPPALVALALFAAACAILVSSNVRLFVQHLAPYLHGRDLHIAGCVAAGVVVLGAVVWVVVRLRRPSAEEMERRRRDHLATAGRITDGILIDARTLGGEESTSPTPEVLIYSYRLAGVTYDCAQDVSMIPERVRGWKLDQPLQVRYDPRNPCNSVVVAESWSGLWQDRPQHSLLV